MSAGYDFTAVKQITHTNWCVFVMTQNKFKFIEIGTEETLFDHAIQNEFNVFRFKFVDLWNSLSQLDWYNRHFTNKCAYSMDIPHCKIRKK